MRKAAVLLLLLGIVAAYPAWRYFRPLSIHGYTGQTSYFRGDTANVFLSANRTVEEVSISLSTVSGSIVDSVITNVSAQSITNPQPWKNGYGYDTTFQYRIPDLESGVYLWEGRVPFVIKDDTVGVGNAASRQTDMVIIYPANTIAAYNSAGGKSLYGLSRWYRVKLAFKRLVSLKWDKLTREPSDDRAVAVTFRRPGNMTHWHYFRPFLEWLSAREKYDISYISDPDLDDYRSIANAKLLVIIGHNEYWTRKARKNFDRYVDSGHPALILSGNTMWWQIRYDDARTRLWCYREKDLDPVSNPLLETLTWTNEQLAYPVWKSIGAQFPQGGYGTRPDSGWNGYKIIQPQSPLLEGVALPGDSIIHVPTHEYDGTWVTEKEGEHPRPDTAKLDFHEIELIGYDYGWRDSTTIPTFIAFQRTPASGRVVNMASTNWCSTTGIGGADSAAIRTITTNAINKLLSNQPIVSGRRKR